MSGMAGWKIHQRGMVTIADDILSIRSKVTNAKINLALVSAVEAWHVTLQQKMGCAGCLAWFPVLGWLLIPFALLAPQPWHLTITAGGEKFVVPVGSRKTAEAIRTAILVHPHTGKA